MYGTRDAAMCWEEEIASLVRSLGLVQSRGSPCNFYNKDKQSRVSVLSDDFTVLGSITERGIFGRQEVERHDARNSTSQSIDFLDQGRCHVGSRSEACRSRDPRIGSNREITTPLTTESLEDSEWYPSLTMRIGYISHDR